MGTDDTTHRCGLWTKPERSPKVGLRGQPLSFVTQKLSPKDLHLLLEHGDFPDTEFAVTPTVALWRGGFVSAHLPASGLVGDLSHVS